MEDISRSAFMPEIKHVVFGDLTTFYVHTEAHESRVEVECSVGTGYRPVNTGNRTPSSVGLMVPLIQQHKMYKYSSIFWAARLINKCIYIALISPLK